jgi:hypothetical protein
LHQRFSDLSSGSGPLLRPKSHATQQIDEPRVVAQRVEPVR